MADTVVMCSCHLRSEDTKTPRYVKDSMDSKLCGRPPQYAPAPCKLKVVSESRVTWATSVPILVFLGLSVVDLGPMYVTDRRQTDRHPPSGTWEKVRIGPLCQDLRRKHSKASNRRPAQHRKYIRDAVLSRPRRGGNLGVLASTS